MLSLSFCTPALNEEALLARCIRSIRSEAPGSPIIVVDNGSSDRTVEVALSFPGVIVIRAEERGITKARQKGLEAATTKWVAFIDADNELPDGWMLAAAKALYQGNVHECPGLELVHQTKPIVAVSGPLRYNDLLMLARGVVYAFYCIGRVTHEVAPMLQGGNFIVDRLAMLAAGGFDTNIEFYGEDTVTAKRLSKVGRVKFDLGLYCISSARRMKAEGLVRIGTRYALNYAWIWLAGRPLTRTHRDHRDAA